MGGACFSLPGERSSPRPGVAPGGDQHSGTPPYGPNCPEMVSSGRRQSLSNCSRRGLDNGVSLFARNKRNEEGLVRLQTKWMLMSVCALPLVGLLPATANAQQKMEVKAKAP